MDDAVLVRGFERVGNLLRQGQGVGERNRAARDDGRKVLAVGGPASKPYTCAMCG